MNTESNEPIELQFLRVFVEEDPRCDCKGHDLSRRMIEQVDFGRGAYIEGTAPKATGLHEAQVEVDKAILNAFMHFDLPGGRTGRYHDTMCGEGVQWMHVARYREGDAEAMDKAVKMVDCPMCLEAMAEQNYPPGQR